MDPKIMWLFAFVALYWSYSIYWGVKSAIISHTAVDYFIAGRQITVWVFVLAATATSFSGWTFIGHPALIYRDGFQYAYASFYAILIPFTGVILLKRQWMIGKRFGFVTPGEMLSHYYQSNTVRLLVIIIALVFSIPYLGLQLRASGFLFNILTDGALSVEVGMWLLSTVVLLYVMVGGLRAAAYVDALQVILLALGIIFIGSFTLYYTAGWEGFTKALATLTISDEIRTPQGYSHYIAIPATIHWVSDGSQSSSGIWTSSMIFTYTIALMGIQSAPAFSMWAFSNHDPRPFAPQQVWASSLGIGFILVIFTAIQGIGGHFLGADSVFNEQHPELVHNMMGAGLSGKDLMDVSSQSEMLVPLLIYLIGDHFPFMVGLLAVCAIAAMQSTASAYMSTASSILTRDLLKYFFLPNASHLQQRIVGRIFTVLVVVAALMVATHANDALVLIGGLAVAYGLQMWPALVGICWVPWFTREGIVAGLIVGLLAVTLTESIGVFFMPWGRWPLTIHSAGWGIVLNFIVTCAVSAMTQKNITYRHRLRIYSFLQQHDYLTPEKAKLKPFAWALVLFWFFFSIGPGSILGNDFFSNPNQPETWFFGIPSIWLWQITFWILGVYMMWFLAYKMELATCAKKEFKALQDDIGDVKLTKN